MPQVRTMAFKSSSLDLCHPGVPGMLRLTLCLRTALNASSLDLSGWVRSNFLMLASNTELRTSFKMRELCFNRYMIMRYGRYSVNTERHALMRCSKYWHKLCLPL